MEFMMSDHRTPLGATQANEGHEACKYIVDTVLAQYRDEFGDAVSCIAIDIAHEVVTMVYDFPSPVKNHEIMREFLRRYAKREALYRWGKLRLETRREIAVRREAEAAALAAIAAEAV